VRFELPSLDDTPPALAGDAGVPMHIALARIDEDPEQPRKEFDEEALAELAATIAARGVRSPISVRPHPVEAGRWMLNFGARRLRAAKAAGCAEIPAFVDITADSFDQIIENEQREALRPLELALFVQRQIVHGMTRTEVARRLGKSQSYLSLVCAMIDPPDWLMAIYRAGKCRGLSELYELRRLHELSPARVEQFLEAADRVGRSDVERLRASLDSTPKGASVAAEAAAGRSVQEGRVGRREANDSSTKATPEDAAILQSRSRPILTARLGRQSVRVVLDEVPGNEATIYVATSSHQRQEVRLDALADLVLSRR
jgi:ParB family chromosome partitioning protein